MSAQDRVRWDNIYQELNRKPFPPPDPLLFQVVPPPASDSSVAPRALDFACGYGQNGLWLAAQGYHVDLMDISRVALTRARSEMAMRNLRNVNALQVDVEQVQLEPSQYQVVCVFRYLKRSLLTELAKSIVPGGRIVYETFNLRYLDLVPGFNVDFLLTPGELTAAFRGWQVLYHEELTHTTQFAAVKPLIDNLDNDDTDEESPSSSPAIASSDENPFKW